VTVAGLATAQKLTREGRQLPRQVILQYLWREDVMLDGSRFGQYAGRTASLPCGGTLAVDQNGNVLAWARKDGDPARRQVFLDAVAERIRAGRIGDVPGSPVGLVGHRVPPLTTSVVDDSIRFALTPHFGIHDDADDEMGGRQWLISS
jgi:hypothetical protein